MHTVKQCMHTFCIIYLRRIFNEIGFAIIFIIDEEDQPKLFQKERYKCTSVQVLSFIYHFWLIGITTISCALDLVARGISSGYLDTVG